MGANGVPDLIIGIDFGMTCTGVAWAKPAFNTTGAVTSWPGMSGNTEIKVPTRLIYKENGAVAKWGFMCDEDDDDEEPHIHEWFKVYLDERYLQGAHRAGLSNVPRTIDDVRRLITDFLRQVYNHVKSAMEATSGSWTSKKVQFLFSTPTTWTSPIIINEFRRIVKNAGFGSENPALHTVEMGLTEAEAVAVYTLKSPPVQFVNGDILLICDAGGGTTDLGLVEISDTNPSAPVLKQLAAVSGIGVGSTLIDRAFEALVQARLDSHPDSSALPPDLASKLARSSQFASVKHRFGTAAGNTPFFFFKTGVPAFSHPVLRVQNGKMEFSRAEIQGLFDAQITVMCRKINDQLDWMTKNKGVQQVRYLVLSGGLGGSEYVKVEIEEYLRNNRHANAPDLAVIRSEEPRLSVTKGLVFDRTQKCISGSSTLSTRISRASYGVIVRQQFNPARYPGHVGADVQMDEFKKDQRWAIDQISWFIKKGDPIDADVGFKQNEFQRKVKPGEATRTWTMDVVISHNDAATRPASMKQGGAEKLCKVTADLSGVHEREFQLKNKSCWQGPKFYLAVFNVHAVIGPADLTFELWFKGKQYVQGHAPITVEFDRVAASARAAMAAEAVSDFEQWDAKGLQ